MSKDKFVDKHGLSEPIDEALKRFSKLTVEEIREHGSDEISLIPDGEFGAIAFKGVQIRKLFHKSEWWFSIVDVVDALTDTTNARRYWSDLKAKMLKDEGFDELYEEIVQLKMESPDGKLRDTDAAAATT